MKRIVLITTAAGFLSQASFCPAQKPQEPAGVAAAAPDSPAATVPRAARKSGTSTTTTGAQNTSGFGVNFFTTGSRGDTIPPVMIRFSQPDTKTGSVLEEDLFVMARVISRTLERAQADGADFKMGVPILLGGRSVRPMYIEGLGPLFMIKVNFTLLPPPKPEENATNADALDSEWRAAQRDVFSETTGVLVLDEPTGRTSSYKEDQVELLKKELVGALKLAANIRGLKSDEFVNIAVFGHATRVRRGSSGLAGNGTTDTIPADLGVNKGSVLTLRARKSDIDAFAAGKLDADAFRTKVLMTAYFGSGNAATSINSWIQETTSRPGR